MLDTVGRVDEITVNKQTGFVVDGHLRLMHAMRNGQSPVPVKYVDLTPDEEALILRTFDPIAGLAGEDKAKVDELMAEISTKNDRVPIYLRALNRINVSYQK